VRLLNHLFFFLFPRAEDGFGNPSPARMRYLEVRFCSQERYPRRCSFHKKTPWGILSQKGVPFAGGWFFISFSPLPKTLPLMRNTCLMRSICSPFSFSVHADPPIAKKLKIFLLCQRSFIFLRQIFPKLSFFFFSLSDFDTA